MPGTPITLVPGTGYALDVTYTRPDGTLPDLTGAALALEIRPARGSSVLHLRLVNGDGITGGQNGKVTVQFTGAHTTTLGEQGWTHAEYALVLDEATREAVEIVSGFVTLRKRLVA